MKIYIIRIINILHSYYNKMNLNFDEKNEEDDDMFTEIDKKIFLQFFKEKRTSRTYIVGLHDFLDDDKIDLFVNKTKKNLGTGITKKTDEKSKKTIYGFQGDHRKELKTLLIKLGIDKDKINISNQ
jgi:translation initiation factor 1 (eIF-1/SUI1)